MSRTIPQWIKDELPKVCCNCHTTAGLVYHHIVPVEVGGVTEPSNIAVVCSKCHGLTHYGKNGAINHGELVKKAMKEAQKRGVHVGKPCADYENVMRLIAMYSTQFNEDGDLRTEHEIMAMAGVKEVCYAKCKRKLKEAMQAEVWPYEWAKPKIMKNMPLYDRVIKKMRREGGLWI